MKGLAMCVALLSAGDARADVLPALYDVVGVAGNDVLNVRANASADSAVLATLPNDANAVEVVALTSDGKWAQVKVGEGAGWVALRYLHKQDRADWFALMDSLECSGTEPFWTVFIDPTTKSIHVNTPDEEGPELNIIASWPGMTAQPTSAVQFASEEASGVAVLRGQACADGMSEQSFGISLDLFQAAGPNQPARTLHGCCHLAP